MEEMTPFAAMAVMAVVVYSILMIIFPLYVMARLGHIVGHLEQLNAKIERPFRKKRGKPDEAKGF